MGAWGFALHAQSLHFKRHVMCWNQGESMKRYRVLVAIGILCLSAATVRAEINNVQMKIGGYLCGIGWYNIKKAVSRLDFAPKLEQIEVFDVKHGLGRFTPKPDKSASFAALKNTLKKSGYKLDAAEITVTGTLLKDGANWWLEVPESKQRFQLQGGEAVTFS